MIIVLPRRSKTQWQKLRKQKNEQNQIRGLKELTSTKNKLCGKGLGRARPKGDPGGQTSLRRVQLKDPYGQNTGQRLWGTVNSLLSHLSVRK